MGIGGRHTTWGFVGLAVALVACGELAVVPDGDAGPEPVDATTTSPSDATTTSRPDATPPTNDATADASPAIDAGDDGAVESDASADAPSDVLVADAADGGTSVRLGADGVVRGTVGGTIVHEWRGSLTAGDARCPAGSVVTNGCCVWSGAFANLTVTGIPIELDLATRSGTLAGSPIGYGVGPTEPDGTVVFQTNPSATHFPKEWPAMEAIGLVSGESAATLAASKYFYGLDVVTPVIFSTSYARVRWNAARSEISLSEVHNLQRKGGCGTGSSGKSGWTLKSL